MATDTTLRYDFFVSYRHGQADEPFAREILSKLEGAGYTGAMDKRDFDPAATFLEEMERCIKESRYTLCIVSQRYLDSGNCQEEFIICKVLGMAERKRRLIPLIIERVEMPVWLYGIVGIDFDEKTPLVPPIERLKNALKKPLQAPAIRGRHGGTRAVPGSETWAKGIAPASENTSRAAYSTSPPRNEIFISYSHRDEKWLEKLKTTLAPLTRDKKLHLWDDSMLRPGDKWREEIRQALERAKIGVLLVSPEFLASDFIANNELPPLLDAAQNEGLTLFWIPIKHSLYNHTPINHYQAAWPPDKPLDILGKGQAKALAQIGEQLKKAYDMP